MIPQHCCYTPLNAASRKATKIDSEQFSCYVGAGSPKPLAPVPTPALISALHVEMRLWPAHGLLPKKYRPNDIVHNGWAAMKVRGVSVAHDRAQKATAVNAVIGAVPLEPQEACVLNTYDKWLLQTIVTIRTNAAALPKARAACPRHMPSTLASVGLSQKLINICVKYAFCWEVAGQYDRATGAYSTVTTLPNVGGFVCALHAPIDREFLTALSLLPLGKYLIDRKLIDKTGTRIRQSNGTFTPWSKLDCLRAYFGIQLVIRHLAIHSWPQGCACTVDTGVAWFGKHFPEYENREAPDWITEAYEIPEEIFDATLVKLGVNARS